MDLKRSLKQKILQRREKHGLKSINVDFKPKQLLPMTEEEKEKDKRRREINKLSAFKSRLKQKKENETNNTVLKQLHEEKEKLKEKILVWEEEKFKLVSKLRKFIPEEKICEALNSINRETKILCHAGMNSEQHILCEHVLESDDSANSYVHLLLGETSTPVTTENYVSSSLEAFLSCTVENSSVPGEQIYHSQDCVQEEHSYILQVPEEKDISSSIGTKYLIISDNSDIENGQRLYVLSC